MESAPAGKPPATRRAYKTIKSSAAPSCGLTRQPLEWNHMDIRTQIASAYDGGAGRDVKEAAPLALAFIGDTVYDLYVRTHLLDTLSATPHKLHLAAAKCVCAAGQAAAFRRVEAELTQEELTQYKRGRNAHSGTLPKNASVADYHTASGFEALIGWLYLSGQDARMTQLMRRALS